MLACFNRSTAILAGALASAVLAASPATAQDSEVIVRGLPEGTELQRVSYSDLDLRFIAHLNILNERVERAVRRVCDFEIGDRMKESYRNCAAGAWAGARPQMHMAYLRANRLASR